MALVVGGASAEMASYTKMAKASDNALLRIARGGEKAEPGEASSGMATISGITVEQAGPANASLLIQADRPLEAYESFALPDPPRLVVDIPNAQHAIHSYPALGANTLIQKIRSSQYKDLPTKVVRLVFDLTSPAAYQVVPQDNQLMISLGGEEKPAAEKAEEAATAPPTSPAASPPEKPAEKPPEKAAEKPAEKPTATGGVGKVTKIDYQALKGKGRILISTEGKVKYEISKISQPLSLVLDISPAEIAPPATQPLDVSLLPGQIHRLRATQSQVEPEKIVRVVAELKGMIKYEVSQSNAGITLDILPSSVEAQEAAAAAAPPSPARAEVPPTEARKISMDFKDADINNLLRILAEVSGANIVSGPEVKGTVTVRLINVSWEQALDAILKSNNFGSLREGNIIRVASLMNIAKELDERRKREAEELKLRELEKKEKIALAPLEQAIISVNYVKADKLMENLEPLSSKDPETQKPRGKLSLHQETKSIIINDTAETIEKMKSMASRLDIRTPQVMIEARIVTVREDYTQSLGIQWGGAYNIDMHGSSNMVIAGSNPFTMTPPNGPNTGNPSLGAPGGAITPGGGLGNILSGAFGLASSTGSYILNLPSSPAGGAPIAGAASLGYIGSRLLLEARISLAESEGKVTTLSAPKVATLDNQDAEIKAGSQIPFTTIDPSSGRLTISFQEAYLRLKVKPHVTSDHKINMEVEAENNTVGQSFPTGVGDVISIDKRIARTQMLVENGATVVLGGLYVSVESHLEDRIPYLGKIPIIGWLFKRRTLGASPTRQELLIFITPSIVQELKV
jgi:type IV pilus assembly protein PilQ